VTPATATLLERLVPSRPARSESEARRAERAQAHAWLRANGLPTARDEAWKYTPLDDILATTFDPAPIPAFQSVDIATVDELVGVFGGPRLVFVNGSFAPELSRSTPATVGVVCGNEESVLTEIPAAFDPALTEKDQYSRFDGFQALNRAARRDTAVVLVAPETHVSEPIHVVHLSVPGVTPIVSHPHTLIQVGSLSRVTIIETYAGQAGRTLTNAATTFDVGPDAGVTHYKLQTEAAGSIHLAHTRINQAARSEVRSCAIMLGADIARNAIDVILGDVDATLHVTGLYLPTVRQRHDNVVTVDHAASAGTSRQVFKGVIDDAARGSFSGRIIVRPHTVATDAGQTSRSLLLQPTAQADTRPWLEIFADDVKCTHGATVGRLDDEAIFYLRTRGIAEQDARTMLIGAFINEVTDDIQPESLRSYVQTATAAQLSFTHAPEATS
jgi:Fe-S cluster assembly protein SufD